MSKKTNEKRFEAWALPLIKKYQNILHLQGYRSEGFGFDKDTTFFKIHTNYPYRGYIINYGANALKDFEEKNYDELKFGLLHEMIHLVVAELVAKAHDRSTRKEVDDSMETTVDHLTVVLSKLI